MPQIAIEELARGDLAIEHSSGEQAEIMTSELRDGVYFVRYRIMTGPKRGGAFDTEIPPGKVVALIRRRFEDAKRKTPRSR